MEKKSSKWLLGCGIGCGVVILIGAVLSVSGFLFFKNTFKEFDEAIETRLVLEEQFGEPGAFVPSADGAVSVHRMQAFLAVRDSLNPVRQRIEETFTGFATVGHEIEEETSFWGKISKGLKMGSSRIALASRTRDLCPVQSGSPPRVGMRLGEYTYIYVLAYYSYLGHAPDDNPEEYFEDSEQEGTNIHIRHDSNWSDVEQASHRIRRDLITMLRSQLATLPPAGTSDTADTWRVDLAAEIDALTTDKRRVVWQDGLPPPIAASFDPFRERLQNSYSPATNPFELTRNRKEGWSIKGD